tara:strand:+ start:488 stop:1339 length:852 start_codon:yes stop_codon:yes gene_type:complete
MIYISTSCIKESSKISDSVLTLVENGFDRIELSGGTEFYDNYKKDLISLKSEYDLNYVLHNYFPPPKDHFVLNLASLDDKVFNQTLEHYKRAIELSELLNAERYGLHAGFLIDPHVAELGKKISKDNLYDRQKCIERFCFGYNKLLDFSDKVKIYIENNVFSYKNSLNFPSNPFLVTDYNTYLELNKFINFPILLDMAHLKVSCNTLGLDFVNETKKIIPLSDYIHISDNDGKSDSNQHIQEKTDLTNILTSSELENKTFTLEIYSGIQKVKDSYNILNSILS